MPQSHNLPARSSRRVAAIATLFGVVAALPAGAGAASRPIVAPRAAEPPTLVLHLSRGVGPVVRSPSGPIEILTVPITDTFDPARAPRDTVPARAVIEFGWHATPAPGTTVTGYSYKLDEPAFVDAGPSVQNVTYNTGLAGDVVAPGVKVFTLKVHDSAGGEAEVTRYFQLGNSPDTWIAGPDTVVLDARFGWSGRERSLDIPDWNALPDLSGSLLSCDSLTLRPAERAPRRMFFEIYRDQLFVRAEYDTVHLNSWIVFHAGGSDLDSPYDIQVEPGVPALVDTLACVTAGTPWVVRPAGLVGAPVGFQSFYGTLLEPASLFVVPPQSPLFPRFDPSSVFFAPVIGAYAAMPYSGKAYFSLRATDSDGAKDTSIPDALAARAIVEAVESGTATPMQLALRPKILVFHVNQAPFLLLDAPGFVPRPNHVFLSRDLSLNLLADDTDPLDPGTSPPRPGGPSLARILRWNVKAIGRNEAGRDTMCAPLAAPSFTPDIRFTLPPYIVSRQVTIEVQLCDCADCELRPGSGRCVVYSIPVEVHGEPTDVLVSLVSAEALPGRVVLRWQVHGSPTLRAERRQAGTAWQELGEFVADRDGRVTVEDTQVEAGERYAYRLVVAGDGAEWTSAEEWVTVPAAPAFALDGATPNPSIGGAVTVRFSLAKAGPARIELIDIAGRRIKVRSLDGLGPGPHEVALETAGIAPGLYVVRLVEDANARAMRVVITR